MANIGGLVINITYKFESLRVVEDLVQNNTEIDKLQNKIFLFSSYEAKLKKQSFEMMDKKR